MPVIITNAILADIDPPRVESVELRIDGGSIVERGASVTRNPGDQVIDCGGCVVLPGLVNGHTHLYSALAVGMPPPPQAPTNFHEILKFVWWRLDRALDAASIEMSARIGALTALGCGTTTLIDHHASPNCIEASLDLLENGLAEVGLRGLLCYEVTDRHGPEGRHAGIEENRRYLERCQRREGGSFGGLVGAHASFTLEDETLAELADLAREFDTGVHMHVAEDPCDEDHCQTEFQMFLIDRLANAGLLRPQAALAHGTHFDEQAVARVNDVGLTMAHNPRSNMNNAVGYAPVGAFSCPVMLGTDGIGADMFAEAKTAWFISRHEQGQQTPATVLAMLAASARRASQALDVTLGQLQPGAAADLVVTDYRPCTPLSAENLPAHFIFAMQAGCVRDVMIAGSWCLQNRQVMTTDADQARREAVGVARGLWERMGLVE